MLDPKGKDYQNEGVKPSWLARLWYFQIKSRCPVCHAELWEVGYPIDFMQAYKCSDRKCGWSW